MQISLMKEKTYPARHQIKSIGIQEKTWCGEAPAPANQTAGK
jgi:hypothetical protein